MVRTLDLRTSVGRSRVSVTCDGRGKFGTERSGAVKRERERARKVGTVCGPWKDSIVWQNCAERLERSIGVFLGEWQGKLDCLDEDCCVFVIFEVFLLKV